MYGWRYTTFGGFLIHEDNWSIEDLKKNKDTISFESTKETWKKKDRIFMDFINFFAYVIYFFEDLVVSMLDKGTIERECEFRISSSQNLIE